VDTTGVFTNDTISITMNGTLVFSQNATSLSSLSFYTGANSVIGDWGGNLSAPPFFNLPAANSPFLDQFAADGGTTTTSELAWVNGKLVVVGADRPEPATWIMAFSGLIALLYFRTRAGRRMNTQ
jgi:hypothetical protein